MNAVTEQIDRQADERFRKADTDSHDTADSHRYTDNGVKTTAAQGSSQVVIVETLGRMGMVVMLVMFVVIVVIGLVAGYALGVGEARAENTAAEVRRLNAKVEVIQWEFDKASAQLIEKGLITPPE